MDEDVDFSSGKKFIAPIKWCRYIVNAGYITVALIIMAHVIWYFAARSVLAWPPEIYLRNYIILPAIGLFSLVAFEDLLVRFSRFSLLVKESLSLSLIILISFYLCLTHDIAEVLLGSFILPIFVSTIFSNIKLTRWVFWASSIAVLLLGIIRNLTGKLDSDMVMQIFVAFFMFLCSYLLAKILIRYGHENLAALTRFDNKQQYMQEQLKLDPFTGLYNRRTFDDYIPAMMEECRLTNKYLSLAMIDVDKFKCVNDLYGHAAGDRVLLYLSEILKTIQAENIRAFRMGGDEFSVIFMDCDAGEAHRICEDIRTRMESCPMRSADEENITLSCGVVCMNPKDVNLEMFTKAADSALYAAKNNGRNQVMVYSDIATA
ncbi:MAG: GGDEF domain-containing protein [Pseudoflavonifractor sp.]|nr:GGDEF domain-containing protein [Pseudoflavonifractor sp.]